MKKSITIFLLILFSFFCFLRQSFAQFTKLYDFNKLNGEEPDGSLITDGTYFYGMTHKGGTNQVGITFKIKPDGSGFIKLMDFKDNNGSNPFGSLFFDGTFLYGTPEEGGTSSFGGNSYYGNVFKIKPDGTSYSQLFDFNGTNGAYPECTLISDGTYLYGTTNAGGTYSRGNIFKIKKDGTGFSSIYEFFYNFSNPNFNGSQPENSLLLVNDYLFGTTWAGGTFGYGVIFKIKTDGTNFTKVYDFNKPTGSGPQCALISDSTYLYGTTVQGGTNNDGVVFKIKLDGTEYQTLYNFSGVDGIEPLGSLIFNNGFLYGMTEQGGVNDWGTIYKIKTDGTQFKTVYDLQVTDGCCPIGSLIPFGGFLYGMTNRGGAFGNGTIFKLDTTSATTNQIDNSISLYPNPTSGTFTLSYNSQTPILNSQLKIYDVLGQEVYTQGITNLNQTTINISQLSNGVYFYQLTNNTETYRGKFVKE